MPRCNSTECLRATHSLGQQVVEIESVAHYVEDFQLLPYISQVHQDHVHSPVLPLAHNHPCPLLQPAIFEAQHPRDSIGKD